MKKTMKKYGLIITTLIASPVLANGVQTSAITTGSQAANQKFSFAIGFGAGYQRLSGSRADRYAAAAGNVPATILFSNKSNLSVSSPNISIYADAIWNAHESFSLGIRPYYSYSNFKSAAEGIDANGTYRVNRVQSRNSFGIDLKPAYNINNENRVFLLAGAEWRSFQLNHFTTANPLFVGITSRASAHKHFVGMSYGGGFEHKMDKNIFGFLLKYTRFNKKTISAVDTTNTNVTSQIKPNIFSAMLTYSYQIM